MASENTAELFHNKFAPYWAAALLVLGATGISTVWFDLGDFWNSYVLDICGPAWNYILFRGLFTAKANNKWTRFFTPAKTFGIFILTCVIIELLQYFKVYDATFDWWDFLAYFSMLVPLFLADIHLVRLAKKRTSKK
jgi:hypothetical protein